MNCPYCEEKGLIVKMEPMSTLGLDEKPILVCNECGHCEGEGCMT
jgi:hypothetical protein